jgi:hypothetical protein
MVIAKLMGGLGNQMFQYALAKSLATQKNTSFKLDLEFLLDRTPRENFVYRNYDLDVFKLEVEVASKKETAPFFYRPQNKIDYVFNRSKRLIKPYKYYQEPHFYFDSAVFSLFGNIYLEGYWQSPRYFEIISQELRKDFTFRLQIEECSLSLLNRIQQSNAVCVNVRRADFVNSGFHGVCDMNYFEPAIQLLTDRIDNPHFFVFSDDPVWCQENFKMPVDITFVGHDHAGSKFSTYLQLMSSCRHFIIPNSSFAWWAVWLSESKDNIVVAPKKWFAEANENWDTHDLIPDNWIRL